MFVLLTVLYIATVGFLGYQVYSMYFRVFEASRVGPLTMCITLLCLIGASVGVMGFIQVWLVRHECLERWRDTVKPDIDKFVSAFVDEKSGPTEQQLHIADIDALSGYISKFFSNIDAEILSVPRYSFCGKSSKLKIKRYVALKIAQKCFGDKLVVVSKDTIEVPSVSSCISSQPAELALVANECDS